MQMRFFNQIGDIMRRYQDLQEQLTDDEFGHFFLGSWGITKDDPKKAEKVEQLQKEHAAITYLYSCKLEMSHDSDEDAIKPDMAILESVFERHLAYIARVHDCTKDNWRKHRFKGISKEYEACRHYLFQLSLPAWVDKLPDVVPTFDHKYPDFENEAPLPIPPID